MFEPGQKVICIDDTRVRSSRLYTAWPVKGTVYTVRDIVPGIQTDMQNTVTVYLCELVNPTNEKGAEYGFHVTRFDTLEELELTEEQEIAQQIGASL